MFLSKIVKLPRFLSLEEARKIFSVAKQENWRDYFVLLFLFFTGVRPSELIKIKISDLHLNPEIGKPYLIVIGGRTKKRERIIPLPNLVVEELKKYLELPKVKRCIRRDQPIFNFSVRQLEKIVKKYAVKVGFPDVTPYTFRHSFATWLRKQGVHWKVIQVLMGHEKIETTFRHYIGVDMPEFDGAIKKLEELKVL